MADQKLTVDLEANAEPLIEALSSISENAESAIQSLNGLEDAGAQASSGMGDAAAGMNDFADSASDATGKLDDIKDSSRRAADGIDALKDKADGANGRLDDIKGSSKKAADGIGDLKDKADKAEKKLEDIKDSSKKAAEGIGDLKDKADGADKKLNAIKGSSARAADGIEEIGKSSKTTAETVTKASQKVIDALEKIEKNTKPKGILKIGDASIRLKSIADVAKKLSEPLKKVIGDLQEIGEAARDLGASPEYFQKLKKASEESGEKFEDVQDVFAKINETASLAFSGDADAAKKLEAIGISVDDLRGKSPEEIFETVTGALAAAGAEAIHSEEAMAVCGDRIKVIGDNLESLSNTDVNISSEDIVPNEAVQAAMEIKESFSKLWQQILVLIAQSGLIEWLGKAAELVGGIVDSFRDINKAKDLVESGEVRDLGREHNKELDKTWRGKVSTGLDVLTVGVGAIPKLWGGRSLGQVLTGYKEEGVDIRADAPTKEEIAKARRERDARMGKQAETDAKKKIQADKTLTAIEASKEEKAKSVSGDRDAERQERQRQREAEQQERQRQREAEQQERQRQREEERAAGARRRAMEQQQREMERARKQASNVGNSSSSEKKEKPKKRAESAPLSTAGGISDKTEARKQRSHELRLAREVAKQRIKIKVKPVKASVIREAVESATSDPLKQLADAVDRLGKQCYIVK